MLIYPGARALSDFRQQKLLKTLKQIDSSVESVEGQYIHFVDAPKLSEAEDANLRDLLGDTHEIKDQKTTELILVTPRPSTISPWSSKATDIAHNCGLTNIKRIERGTVYYLTSSKPLDRKVLAPMLHDRMTEVVFNDLDQAKVLFNESKPRPALELDILKGGRAVLKDADKKMGLALSEQEIDYLYESYKKLKRNPTDIELMMFGVVNSEHCRHKIFNADFIIDGQPQPKSLFKMIKNTYENSSQGILSAYSDNAAVLQGPEVERLITTQDKPGYRLEKQRANLVIKVETHNHPTAISPYPGAATGIGGEIRDEVATGRGAKSKASLSGYSVSNLQLPGAKRAWEKDYGKPERISSPLQIMIEAPLGGAGYANEFGRPNIAGYFRTYEQDINGTVYGYHKPIMIAGGIGNITDDNLHKKKLEAGDKLIVLGGPSMLIGLGGGAASSMQTGHGEEELDFASVQRDNAELQRRAQEVIDRCWALEKNNPIISIHDVGAGGLSNAFPELLKDSNVGGRFELRDIPSADHGMSPMEIWCNEAQERYVLGISAKDLKQFEKICQRERCPYGVVGEADSSGHLIVNDSHFKNMPIDIPLDLLFGNPPKLLKDVKTDEPQLEEFDPSHIQIDEAVQRVLSLPAVGSKKFLITIGDRTVGGLVTRDPMVGPWQVPVADVAVTASTYEDKTGEAMAIGERTPLAIINSGAAARMAVGESITNIAAADITKLSDVKLSANWMAASGEPGQDQKLYEAVKAVGEQFCPALDLSIPVGKDSLSMRTKWEEAGEAKSVTSPVSLIVSAFSPVADSGKTLTPQLVNTSSSLILIDLGQGKNRLGGSALAQVYNHLGNASPDITPELLGNFFSAISDLKSANKILAYHDRSDGGLLATLAEMSFAGRVGMEIDLGNLPGETLEKLFSEELGAVIQVKEADQPSVMSQLKSLPKDGVYTIGHTTEKQQLVFTEGGKVVYKNSRATLEKLWADTSYQIQKLRDNPKSADEELATILDDNDPGLSAKAPFNIKTKNYSSKPKVAILREQGVNGQVEMAAAFGRAGFTAVDVHLSDLASGAQSFDKFVGLAVCGGFSYGDVLGAGEGFAKSVLFNPNLRSQFAEFFEREDTFSLGVCNGCQMLAALKQLIPGAEHWPRFLKNRSEQFEARLSLVKINDSPSIFFKGMAGSILPIPTAHGEGRAEFDNSTLAEQALANNLVPLQFIDNFGRVTQAYPSNPNGSAMGITALTSSDGRATIIMPHPERVFLSKQLSWHPEDWGTESPWFKLFQNARAQY